MPQREPDSPPEFIRSEDPPDEDDPAAGQAASAAHLARTLNCLLHFMNSPFCTSLCLPWSATGLPQNAAIPRAARTGVRAALDYRQD
jgi:hypothetical protein